MPALGAEYAQPARLEKCHLVPLAIARHIQMIVANGSVRDVYSRIRIAAWRLDLLRLRLLFLLLCAKAAQEAKRFAEDITFVRFLCHMLYSTELKERAVEAHALWIL